MDEFIEHVSTEGLSIELGSIALMRLVEIHILPMTDSAFA